MPNYRSISDMELDGKKVLLRAGFDVPMSNGTITDISRIEAIVPTMRFILDHGAALIIMAHQDRPKGKVVPEFSQRPLVPVLEKLLGCSVQFAASCTGSDTKQMVDALTPGQVLLLENLRFDAREEANDASFAQELASLADVYVNDAFSNSHRSHASMVAVAALLPSCMGLQLEQEVQHLSAVLDSPRHPLALIVSGAKIETKLPVIEYFLQKGDDILLGGAIANTFVASAGTDVGKSLYEASFINTARKIVHSPGARVHVPVDFMISSAPDESAQSYAVSSGDIPPHMAAYDVGIQSTDEYVSIIEKADCIVWNGPLGIYETPQFAEASKRIAQAMQAATKRGATTIVGGGDTIDLHIQYGLDLSAYTFVSTGGGAMLDFVSGKKLPAIEALAAGA